jgi:hypothetical protein
MKKGLAQIPSRCSNTGPIGTSEELTGPSNFIWASLTPRDMPKQMSGFPVYLTEIKNFTMVSMCVTVIADM